MDKFILFLCSCFIGSISIASAGALEQGIISFQKKDYAQAEKLWQPLAEKGDVRAQYNLAILFKYGKKNTLQRKNAVKYLAMSRSEGLVDAYYVTIPVLSSVPALVSTLVSTPVTVSVPTLASTPVSKAAKSTKISDPLVWLNQQQKNTYTLQLATGKNRKSMDNMQKKLISSQTLGQPQNLYIHRIETNEQQNSVVRYVLTYGIFKTYQDAQDEVGKLPESIQKSSPWIRQFEALQLIVNGKQENKNS